MSHLEAGDFTKQHPHREKHLPHITTLWQGLAQDIISHKYPFLSIDHLHQEFEAVIPQLQTFRDTHDLVYIIGTGGSSLSGKALQNFLYYAYPEHQFPCRLIFVETVEPHFVARCLSEVQDHKIGIIVISKSGKTLETNTLFEHFLAHLPAGRLNAREDVIIITEDSENNPLHQTAKTFGMTTWPHPREVGGRFSAFSIVGLTPCYLLGGDIHAFINGAKLALQQEDQIIENCLFHILAYEYHNVSQTVVWPYIQALELWGTWFQQLWAESLGKKGFGFTPIVASGAIAQHSQLQLYVEGPKNKSYSLILPHSTSLSPLAQFNQACAASVVWQLQALHVPIRVSHIDDLTENSLGFLMMMNMIETLIMAMHLCINPLNQEGVEAAKTYARSWLEQHGRSKQS